jgi:hypothetical protein
MILESLLILATASAHADEPSVTMKSIEFCMSPALSNPTKTVQVSSGRRLFLTSSPKSLQLVFDNSAHRARAFSVTLPAGATEIVMNDPAFVGQYGATLSLELKNETWKQAAHPAKVSAKASQVPTIDAAIEIVARDMREILMSAIAKGRYTAAQPEVFACYSGLQALIANYSLKNTLSDEDKAKLKAALFPKENERQSDDNGSTSRQ